MQAALWVVLALWLKHYVISSLLDVGYSESRHPRHPPWKAFFRHTGLEMGITWYACHSMETMNVCYAVGAEIFLLALGCALERRAPLRQALAWHVGSEMSLLAFYGLVSWAVAHG